LVNQPYYNDEEKTAATILKENNASVSRFTLMELGN